MPSQSHRLVPRADVVHLASLVETAAASGSLACLPALVQLVTRTGLRERAPTLAAVLLDPATPGPARARAFGRVAWHHLAPAPAARSVTPSAA